MWENCCSIWRRFRWEKKRLVKILAVKRNVANQYFAMEDEAGYDGRISDVIGITGWMGER